MCPARTQHHLLVSPVCEWNVVPDTGVRFQLGYCVSSSESQWDLQVSNWSEWGVLDPRHWDRNYVCPKKKKATGRTCMSEGPAKARIPSSIPKLCVWYMCSQTDPKSYLLESRWLGSQQRSGRVYAGLWVSVPMGQSMWLLHVCCKHWAPPAGE